MLACCTLVMHRQGQLKTMARTLFREVIDEFVLDMANGVVTAVRLYLQNDTSTTAEFMHDAVLDEIRYEIFVTCRRVWRR